MPTKFGSYRGSDLLGADYTKSHWSEPVSPVTQADGHKEPGLIGELVPRLAAVIEDVAVRGEDPVREPVLAHELPDVLDRVQLGRLRRERHKGDVGRDHKSLGLMPARLVHEEEGMRPGCNRLRNLVQVQGHALRGAAGQNQAGSLALSWANCAKDVGRGGPLVLGGGRAGATFGPAPGDLVLLPNPGLIGEPDLDRLAINRLCDFLQAGGKVFFKSRHHGLALGVMARTGRELAIVHGPQLARQRLLGEGKAELLPEPRDQVDQTPAHHAVDGRNGPLLDDGLQGRAMRVGEFRGLAGRLAVDQALGPMGVELHHPVPHDLHRDPAAPGHRGAGCPLIDRGQGQKAPRLAAILRRAGNRAQRMGIKVCPERNRHGEPPSFATLNQTCLKPTRPNRVTPSGTWYYKERGSRTANYNQLSQGES